MSTMSTTTPAAKKPLSTATAGRRTPNSTATSTGPPSRSPSRLAGASSNTSASATTATGTNGVSRTRSIRNGAPVSARAAVRKPTTPDNAADEDAKAEMQSRIDELQERLQHAERQNEESQKQATVLQVKLDEAHKEQGLLEESVHEHTERIEDLENEKKESLRARREMEQIYESERAAAMKEKEESASREEEMQNAMQRLRESLAQREMRAGLEDDRRPSPSRQSSYRTSNNASPSPDTPDRQFAPPSVQRSDSSSRNNSKLVMQKDKIIESLRLELAEAQIKLVEVENMGGGRMQEQQKQIYDLKMQNARLMEENESFQLLLSEKTLNGDFLRPTSRSQSRPPSSMVHDPGVGSGGAGTTLAEELEAHVDVEGGEEVRRLQGESNSLREQNKALTLYINNIISRLLQHEQFEQILDKTPDLMAGPNATMRKTFGDKDLPPPPQEQDEEQPTGFLQRAKSVIGGKKPRPLSNIGNEQLLYAPTSQPRIDDVSTVHENPETAPSVPLGRSRSVRNTGGHRRVNSEWSAANVVTNMYRGPSSVGGPLSPGLASPTNRNSFFAGQFPRQSSLGSPVPTISGLSSDYKENSMPQRDSKISGYHSNRNSVISNPGFVDGLEKISSSSASSTAPDTAASTLSSERTNPSSPPRSIASSGDRDSKSSGAIMMGSRMRPLRLVQEAVDQDELSRKQHQGPGSRGSWFGWMNKGPSVPVTTTSPPTLSGTNPPSGSTQ